jgi:hypothetical protein
MCFDIKVYNYRCFVYFNIEIHTLRYRSASILNPDTEAASFDFEEFSISNLIQENVSVDIKVCHYEIKILDFDIEVLLGGGKVPDGTTSTTVPGRIPPSRVPAGCDSNCVLSLTQWGVLRPERQKDRLMG